jgi:hypothetical protein
MRSMLGMLTLGAFVMSAPMPVLATHPNPGPKAKKITGDLVMAYEPCTTPDTALDGYPTFGGCSAPVRSDPACGFGPTGRGQVKMKAAPQTNKLSEMNG